MKVCKNTQVPGQGAGQQAAMQSLVAAGTAGATTTVTGTILTGRGKVKGFTLNAVDDIANALTSLANTTITLTVNGSEVLIDARALAFALSNKNKPVFETEILEKSTVSMTVVNGGAVNTPITLDFFFAPVV